MSNKLFIVVIGVVTVLVLTAVTFHTSAGHHVLHAIHGDHSTR